MFFLGYLDFETYHEPIEELCLRCDELNRKTRILEVKKEIIENCQTNSHVRIGKKLCDGCITRYYEKLEKCNCIHEKMTYKDDGVEKYFSTCNACHTEILSQVDCTYLGTIRLTRLTPASYNFT